MAPHVSALLISRDDDSSSSVTPTIIAGIIVAAVIGVGCAAWLAVRWYRKRSATKREQLRPPGFATYGSSVDDMDEKSSLPSVGSALDRKGTFSRHQLGPGIVMPERAILRPGASRDEILEHYTAEGKLPRPFAPFAPPPAALTSDGDRSPSASPASSRPVSTASWAPPFALVGNRNSHRMSAMSVASSIGSAGAAQKKVRQIFDPVLPDELVVSLGETLTLVQQHDDGWAIVGRDSVFKPGEVELGAVPAWCFLKPVKGLRAERPMRVSSLGVTVNLDPPTGFAERENVMSWSNF